MLKPAERGAAAALAPPPPRLETLLAVADPAHRVALSSAALRAVNASRGDALHLDEGAGEPPAGEILWSYDRALLGLPLGMVDAGAMRPAKPGCLAAAEEVLRSYGPIDLIAVEIADPLESDPRLRGFAPRLGGAYLAAENRFHRRALLPLPDSWEVFVQRAGRNLRHNIARDRTKAEAAGLCFSLRWGPPGPRGAEHRVRLAARAHPVPKNAARMAAADRFIADRSRPFEAELRAPNDRLAAYATGYLVGGAAYLFLQIHALEGYEHLSLSLLLRAHLVEALIKAGVEELVFSNGCLGALSRMCLPQAVSVVTLVRRSAAGRAKVAAVRRFFPSHPAVEALRIAAIGL